MSLENKEQRQSEQVTNKDRNKLVYSDNLVSLYTRTDHLMPEIQDKSVHAIISDPPYGVDFVSQFRVATKKFSRMQDDSHLIEWTPKFILECYRILQTPGALVLFTRWDVYPKWIKFVENCGFRVKQVWIWDKGEAGSMGDLSGTLRSCTEWIMFCTKGDFKFHTFRRGDIFRFTKVAPGKRFHPIEKPVPIMQELIKIICEGYKDPVVVDPYAGSGSTLMAAKLLHIKAIGYELPKDANQNYAEIVSQRLSQTTMQLI